MPQTARVVIPGYPHHVIQRGNRRQKVFFNDDDRRLYLKLLSISAKKAGLKFWAYCLMENHVHFVAVPERETSLAQGFGRAHRAYTSYINAREGWTGCLWQKRFSSYPMDEIHLYTAVPYIELNPVRIHLVERAADYLWSSARAHVSKSKDAILSDFFLLDEIKDWALFLCNGISDFARKTIAQHARNGLPLGDEHFLSMASQIRKKTVN
jgi:putative transposase